MSAVDKAFALLATILAVQGRRSIAALADEQRLPLSTAHRFVAAMMRRRLITRVARGRYASSFLIARGSDAAQLHRLLALSARPHARKLAQTTGTTVHFGILEGDMVTYLVKEAVGRELFTREGMQLEAYSSAVGKVLLAHASADSLDAYLANGPFVALTTATITEPAAIRDHLQLVREIGYATDDREVDDELGCVAVPVYAADGSVIAALSSSASPPRPVTNKMLSLLGSCAEAITASLV